MCGICGIINLNSSPADRSQIETMMKTMKYRGPDDEGIFIDSNMGLGHVRLSILDLSSAGRQPMFNNDGRYCIVYNGEIFNYVELRNELKDKYDFITGTDTEVVLAAYQEWGTQCLQRFNGMWAFALYDTLHKSVFIARDRYGVKPLFYYLSENAFVFASEIKALFSVLKKYLSVNKLSIYEYLIYSRTDQSTNTFINEIKRLQHGYTVAVTGNAVTFQQWYNLNDHLDSPWESPEEFRAVFSSALGIRLRSDVPVGVCLSGGLDSSSITSTILKDYGLADLYTFSAVYGEGKQGDESRFINIYKPLLPNLKYVHPTEETFLDEFDSFMDCHFEPVHTLSIYSQFKVLKEASRYVTVALDGQGADEQLGGYHNFFGSYFLELLREFRILRLISELTAYLKHHKSSVALQYLMFYLLPGHLKDYAGTRKLGWVDKDYFEEFRGRSNLGEALFNPKGLMESLLQHFEYKLEHNLKWNDLNSMYFSVELRVPFMDYRIVEKNLSIPSDQIINKGYTKWILRRAMEGTLPEVIRLRQDKVGFDNPSDEWFKSPSMRAVIDEVLNSEVLRNSRYVNLEACRKKYKLHLSGKININKEIWEWINLYFLLCKFR